MIQDFANLHLHSEYSYLDGYGSALSYIRQAKKLKMNYIGITDHGSIDGLIEWQTECEKNDILHILGAELYIVPDANQKDKNIRNAHIIFLIKNQQGFETLCQLLTKANLHGFYRKPRISFSDLLHNDLSGLIITTACVNSWINFEGAEKVLKELYDKYPGNIYLEIQPHDFKLQYKYHNKILDLHEKYNIPLLATNDCHYPNKDDWETQEVLLAMQSKKTWDDPKRFKFEIQGLHLKTRREMQFGFKKHIFNKDQINDALNNTIKIAKMCCNFKIQKQEISLPSPFGKTDNDNDILAAKCASWINEHYIENGKRKRNYKIYRDRWRREFELIKKKNFSRYFLVVQDFVQWAKSEGIEVGPARGSAGGSLICHMLGITNNIDPIKYRLSFSRFISEDRLDLPDIDIDVEKRYKEKCYEYLKNKYGENNICGISTVMKMQSNEAFRRVCRVFDIPLDEVSDFAKLIKDGIQKTIDENKECRRFEKKYPRVIHFAKKMEGSVRGCLSGNSYVLLKNSIGGIKVKTIKKLYEENYRGKIRSYDFEKGILFFDNVVDIYQSGIKKVYKLTLAKNRNIVLTKDHRLLTKNGWKNAEDLKIGESIAVNGVKGQIPWNKGLKGVQKAWNKGKRGVQVAWNKGLTKDDHPSIAKSSERMKKNNPSKTQKRRDEIGKQSFKHGRYCNIPQYKKEHPICEICKKKKAIECHHKDKDRYNNDFDNLLNLCSKCHHKVHKTIGKGIILNKINKKMTIGWNRVTSFEYIGKEMTYDIQMGSKNQNFVCNKIITHNSGRHAAAVVISDEDLTLGTKCNLAKRKNDIVCNWDMDNSEYSGLMKLDVLGLSTLTVLAETRKLINESQKDNPSFWYHPESDCYFVDKDVFSEQFENPETPTEIIDNIAFSFDKIPFDDEKVFKLLSTKKTAGIFQMSTSALANLCKKIKIDNFNDIVAAIALVRPGPYSAGMTDEYIKRKHGKKWRKLHPIYEEITKDTFGIIVYQEQISKIIYKIAGLSKVIADKIRKIIAKKKDPKLLEEYHKVFIEGCIKEKTLSKEEAIDFWDSLMENASYLFNLAHSTAYAIIGYWTGYCKANYPVEFICSSLSFAEWDEKSKDKYKRKSTLINELIDLNIEVYPPKIGYSDPIKWIVKDNNLYVPFIEISGIGEKQAIKCSESKKKVGRLKGFFEKDDKYKKLSQKGKTKIDIIMDELECHSHDKFPENKIVKQYLGFNI